jgi:hypothetical protein
VCSRSEKIAARLGSAVALYVVREAVSEFAYALQITQLRLLRCLSALLHYSMNWRAPQMMLGDHAQLELQHPPR